MFCCCFSSESVSSSGFEVEAEGVDEVTEEEEDARLKRDLNANYWKKGALSRELIAFRN